MSVVDITFKYISKSDHSKGIRVLGSNFEGHSPVDILNFLCENSNGLFLKVFREVNVLELPVVIDDRDLAITFIDPTDITTMKVIGYRLYNDAEEARALKGFKHLSESGWMTILTHDLKGCDFMKSGLFSVYRDRIVKLIEAFFQRKSFACFRILAEMEVFSRITTGKLLPEVDKMKVSELVKEDCPFKTIAECVNDRESFVKDPWKYVSLQVIKYISFLKIVQEEDEEETKGDPDLDDRAKKADKKKQKKADKKKLKKKQKKKLRLEAEKKKAELDENAAVEDVVAAVEDHAQEVENAAVEAVEAVEDVDSENVVARLQAEKAEIQAEIARLQAEIRDIESIPFDPFKMLDDKSYVKRVVQRCIHKKYEMKIKETTSLFDTVD